MKVSEPLRLGIRSDHHIFPHVVDMLTFAMMMAKAIEQLPGQSIVDSYDYAIFPCKAVSGGGLLRVEMWTMRILVEAIATGVYPRFILPEFVAASVQDNRVCLLGKSGLEQRMQYATFALYMDRVREWLAATNEYSDVNNWPKNLHFARVVRNAIVHRKLNFSNSQAKPASWFGLCYGPAQNGQLIFPNDMDTGDLVILMWMTQGELFEISKKTGRDMKLL